MKFNKMSKTGATMLLMIISIGVLILPATAITYSEQTTITHILTVQDNYFNGTDIMTTTLDQAEIIDILNIDTELGESPTNDTGLYGYRTSGVITTRDSIYWEDFSTYLGNGTYNMTCDYSNVPTSGYSNRKMIIELDINNSEWVEYDFIKLYTGYDDSTTAFYFNSGFGYANSILTIETEPNEFISINSFSWKSQLLNNPDGNVWIVFNIPIGVDNATFDFKIEAFNLTTADAVTWNDAQVYVLVLLASDIILLVGFLFTTNFIDIAIDKSKPQKPRKKYKR